MKRGQTKRDGQVWAESFGKLEFFFLVIGGDKDFYRLLCLEDGQPDEVAKTAFKRKNNGWRRVT